MATYWDGGKGEGGGLKVQSGTFKISLQLTLTEKKNINICILVIRRTCNILIRGTNLGDNLISGLKKIVY